VFGALNVVTVTPQSKPTPNNARIIARNSFWYGLEMAFVFVSAVIATIIMARVIGPQKLGYFNYIQWLANISGFVGSLGIPMTTRKYMAEYLGRGEAGIARAVFFATLRLQTLIALLITGVALAVVVSFCDPTHRLVSAIQVASILPAMAVYVPAQANTARENLKANVAGSVVQGCIYLGAVILSLACGWGLLGIAIGIFAGRATELAIRAVPVLRWVQSLPHAPLPDELRKRMLSFSGQGTLLMLLNIVVWDRSDIVLLKLLNSDVSQISFYSLAFNLAERAMVFPQTFGTAIGATIMAQYGRDKSRLSSIASATARYMLLCALPLLLGLAAISSPAIRLVYGEQYIPAIPVLAVASVLAISKPLLLPAQQLLQADEKQWFLVWWGFFCGGINVALDLLLIPHFAALGAAIANGVAQTVAVTGIWIRAAQVFKLKLDTRGLVKIGATGIAMALCVVPISLAFRPLISVVLGIAAGVVVFLVGLRGLRVLHGDDRNRLMQLQQFLPPAVRGISGRVVNFAAGWPLLAPPEAAIAGVEIPPVGTTRAAADDVDG
jgi:O-antigen/teichoic acid export membrane protein